jgi:hypothetical protein
MRAGDTSLTSSKITLGFTLLSLLILLLLHRLRSERYIPNIPQHHLPVDTATHNNIRILRVELKRDDLKWARQDNDGVDGVQVFEVPE